MAIILLGTLLVGNINPVVALGTFRLSRALLTRNRPVMRSNNDGADDDTLLAGIDSWLESNDMKSVLSAMEEWSDDEDETSLEAFLEENSELGFDERAVREQAFLGQGHSLPICENEVGTSAVALNLAMKTDGVARISGSLSEETCALLREHVLAELKATDANDSGEGRLSKVMSPSAVSEKEGQVTRWDLKLKFENDAKHRTEVGGERNPCIVRRAVDELCSGAVGRTVADLQGGTEAELWELAAMVTAPGAVSQIVHADCCWTPEPLLLSAFVALQPVTRAMGPTRFLPGTHNSPTPAKTIEVHGDVTGLKQRKDDPEPASSFGILITGDATLYDGRLLHCGTANDSDELRVLFYVTFRHADAKNTSDPSRSLLSSYQGRYNICDFVLE